jgi:MFS family permease
MIRRTLTLLTLAQALYWSCAIVGITMTLVVSATLAPSNLIASLPLALLVVTYMAVSRPLAHHMQAHGRRPALVAGALAGAAAGAVYALGLWQQSFWLFCSGSVLLGFYQASAMAYRFAALDTAPPQGKGRAAAWVLSGGLIAALGGPSLSALTRDALPIPFMGSYLLMSVMGLVGAGFLLWLPRDHAAKTTAPRQTAPSRRLSTTPLHTPWKEMLTRRAIRTAILTTALGHGVMILVMNATPMAMVFCGHAVTDASKVIQWHVIGMFAPALISGRLVDWLGSRRMAGAGSLILLASGGIALGSQALWAFALSSGLLGLGWNLMLVAG